MLDVVKREKNENRKIDIFDNTQAWEGHESEKILLCSRMFVMFNVSGSFAI